MNHCGIQQKNTFASSCEPMVCPKPRRLSLFNTTMNEPVRPLRWHMCYQPEPYESKTGLELLDVIFEKGTRTHVASSPPFYNGSPPSRVSNPLIQDSRFGDDIISPGMTSSSSSSSSSSRLSGNSSNKPAVRIEGFDCLDRDNRQNPVSLPWLKI